MKSTLLCALALLPVPLLAQGERPPAPERSSDPNQVICRTISDIGSRLRKTRVCRTRAGWEDLRRMQRDFNEDIQLRGRGETKG